MFCMTRNYRSKRTVPRSAGGPKRWPTIPAWCNWAACSPALVITTQSVSAGIWPICGWTTTTPGPAFARCRTGRLVGIRRNNPRRLFNFAFSLGCCASQDPLRSGGQYTSPPTFDTLLRQSGDEIAFHIMNGDTIYEELRDGTREGIRANYRLYWQRGRSWSRLLRNVPTLFTYDDHEMGWDIHGCGEVGLGAGKWLIRDLGTSVWNEYCGWSSYPEHIEARSGLARHSLRPAAARLHDPQANFSTLDLTTVSTLHIDPYTPAMEGEQLIHRPVKQFHKNAGVYAIAGIVDAQTLELDRPLKTDGTATYSIGTHHWYDWQVGNCHFFALDTRGERTRPNFADYRDPTRFILGEAQRRGCSEELPTRRPTSSSSSPPTRWSSITRPITSIRQRGGVPKGDGFSSFVHQREQLIEKFDQLDKPVLVFTGDVHASASVQITDNVWEMMCGPMGSTNHPLGTCGGGTMPLGWRLGKPGPAACASSGSARSPTTSTTRVCAALLCGDSSEQCHAFATPEGIGYQWVAFDAPQVVVRWHDGYTGRLVYAEGISAKIRAHSPGTER